MPVNAGAEPESRSLLAAVVAAAAAAVVCIITLVMV